MNEMSWKGGGTNMKSKLFTAALLAIMAIAAIAGRPWPM
jgi:hypothetical protein